MAWARMCGSSNKVNFSDVFNGTDGLNENLSIVGGAIQGTPKYINIRATDDSVTIVGIDFTKYRYMLIDAQVYSRDLQYRIPNVKNWTSILTPGAGRTVVTVDISQITGVQLLDFAVSVPRSGYGYIYNITLSE